MKENFGVGIPLDVVTGPVELLNYGFLLGYIGNTVESIRKILIIFNHIYTVTHDFTANGLFQQVGKITNELLLFLTSQTAYFLYPLGLGYRPGFQDRIQPVTQ